ncbi:hypothetical protein [Aestuariimicrobium ganziense]|uniref:hypothetical protein n=1 Tax=Aestuariimicrobium ganziense TaxID=2773677 RepID=UPI001943C39C|nr:hypothetical protein [Aestuariimicrobium ganziense]
MAIRVRKPAKGKTDLISKKIADKLTIGSKRPAKALDVDQYGNLRRGDVVGDGLEHDHIPSLAALKKQLELEQKGKLTPAQERWLRENGTAITIPRDVHKRGRTHGGKNTKTQINLDAQDLAAAAERDYAALRKNLLDDGYDAADVDAAIDKIREINKKRGIG